jgi:hypothetical protein
MIAEVKPSSSRRGPGPVSVPSEILIRRPCCPQPVLRKYPSSSVVWSVQNRYPTRVVHPNQKSKFERGMFRRIRSPSPQHGLLLLLLVSPDSPDQRVIVTLCALRRRLNSRAGQSRGKVELTRTEKWAFFRIQNRIQFDYRLRTDGRSASVRVYNMARKRSPTTRASTIVRGIGSHWPRTMIVTQSTYL